MNTSDINGRRRGRATSPCPRRRSPPADSLGRRRGSHESRRRAMGLSSVPWPHIADTGCLRGRLAPRSGDGEGDPGALEVGEQPVAVLRFKHRTGPFRAGEVTGVALGEAGRKHSVVLREGEDLAVGCKAMEETRFTAVLAQHEAAAGADRHVVRCVQGSALRATSRRT